MCDKSALPKHIRLSGKDTKFGQKCCAPPPKKKKKKKNTEMVKNVRL